MQFTLNNSDWGEQVSGVVTVACVSDGLCYLSGFEFWHHFSTLGCTTVEVQLSLLCVQVKFVMCRLLPKS